MWEWASWLRCWGQQRRSSERILPSGQHSFTPVPGQVLGSQLVWSRSHKVSSQRSCLLESEEDHHGSIPRSYTAGAPRSTQQLKVWRPPCHLKLPTPDLVAGSSGALQLPAPPGISSFQVDVQGFGRTKEPAWVSSLPRRDPDSPQPPCLSHCVSWVNDRVESLPLDLVPKSIISPIISSIISQCEILIEKLKRDFYF